jgi:GAF domain-containing protein
MARADRPRRAARVGRVDVHPVETEEAIAEAAASPRAREARARAVADLIRAAGGYRWVGVYDVLEDEVAIVAWSGPGPPAFPRFSRDRGLTGAAIASRTTVVVNDVGDDPRYLEAFGDTRAEIVVPVEINAQVRGTIDVESAADPFNGDDETFLRRCADAALPLWRD